MSIASPPQVLAFTGPLEFRFASRKAVKVQVRFYEDAAGTIEIAYGTGTRDVVATTTDLVIDLTTDYSAEIESAYAGGAKLLTGGTWTEFEFADGAVRAAFACSGGANPAGPPVALSYRVILSIEKLTPAPTT